MAFKLMGVLNVTPDSFYDGGRFMAPSAALKQAERLIKEGAHILDIGGESSRPGARPISAEEEKKRVLPILKGIKKKFEKIKISVDTVKSEVAQAAFGEGATILNDISGLRDPEMLGIIRKFKPTVVLMHSQGEPGTMQKNPRYKNVAQEVKSFLKKRMEFLLSAGISRNKIWLDPGIGFGKTFSHNLQLLKSLKEFSSLGAEVLIGCSRKSFIGKAGMERGEILGVEERLEGSLAAAVWAYLNGASVFRVHDVAATKKALQVAEAIRGA